MIGLKKEQQLYLLFAIFGITLIVVYYNALFKPQFLRFIVNNREYYAIKTRVKKAEFLISNEERIKRQYEELSKKSQFYEERLPAQDEIPTLLETFSTLAESSGVKILKIKPLKVIDADREDDKIGSKFYSEFPILIEAKAGFHESGIFINKLENMDRFIGIYDIDIIGDSSSSGLHDIKIRMLTYVMH